MKVFCCNCQSKAHVGTQFFPSLLIKGTWLHDPSDNRALTLGDVEQSWIRNILAKNADWFSNRSHFDKVYKLKWFFLSIPKQPYSYYITLETVHATVTNYFLKPTQQTFSVLILPDLNMAFNIHYLYYTAICSNSAFSIFFNESPYPYYGCYFSGFYPLPEFYY